MLTNCRNRRHSQDTAEMSSLLVGAVDAVKDTIEDAKPSVKVQRSQGYDEDAASLCSRHSRRSQADSTGVQAFCSRSSQVHLKKQKPAVSVADSVKGAVEDVKPSVQSAADSVKGATKVSRTQSSVQLRMSSHLYRVQLTQSRVQQKMSRTQSSVQLRMSSHLYRVQLTQSGVQLRMPSHPQWRKSKLLLSHQLPLQTLQRQ